MHKKLASHTHKYTYITRYVGENRCFQIQFCLERLSDIALFACTPIHTHTYERRFAGGVSRLPPESKRNAEDAIKGFLSY